MSQFSDQNIIFVVCYAQCSKMKLNPKQHNYHSVERMYVHQNITNSILYTVWQ